MDPNRPLVNDVNAPEPESLSGSAAAVEAVSAARSKHGLVQAIFPHSPNVSGDQSPFRFNRLGLVLTVFLLFVILAVGIGAFLLGGKAYNTATPYAIKGKGEQALVSANVQGYDQLLTPADKNLSINGAVTVNGAFTLAPSTAPGKPSAGQLYFDNSTHLLNYFNGSNFVALVQGAGGLNGKNGVNGFSGANGSNGAQGPQGLQGAAGAGIDPSILANIAYTNKDSQIFTGNSQLFKNTADSSNAFRVQNAAGSNLFTVDTASSNLVVGNDGNPSLITIRGGVATAVPDATGATIRFDASNGNGTGGSGDLVFRTASTNTGSPYLDTGSNVLYYGYTPNTSSFTFGDTINNVGDRVLLVQVLVEDPADSVSGVTWAGQPLTHLASQDCSNDGATCKVEVWYLVNPSPGSYAITVNYSSPQTFFIGMNAADFGNVNPSDPFGTVSKQAGFMGDPTSFTVPTVASQLVVDAAVNYNGFMSGANGSGTNLASGQQWVSSMSFQSPSYVNMTDKIATSSTTTLSYREQFPTNMHWAEIAVPLNPPSASGLQDRLHISSSGNVGINNDTPQYVLDVGGNGNFKSDSTTAFQVQNAAGNSLLTVDTTGTGAIKFSSGSTGLVKATVDANTGYYRGSGITNLGNSGSYLTWNDINSNSAEIAGRTTGDPTFIVRGAAGQTANLLQIQDNGNNLAFSIAADGSSLFKPASDSTTAFQVQNSSGTPLLSADTAGMKLTVQALVINATLTINGHIITGGSAPAIAAGAGAGSGPAVAISGNDDAGTVTVTTGSTPGAGALATVTFSAAYGAAPHVTLTPTAAASSAALQYYTTVSGTSFTLNSGNAPSASTTYTYDYHVVQ